MISTRALTPVLRLTWIATLLAIMSLGCAGKPKGPLFEALAPPESGSALVYIYRDDVVRGVGSARLKFDGEDLGELKNGEYTALVVYAGRHTVRSALMWFGLFARSWHKMDFEVTSGQTQYIRLSASTQSLAAGPAAATAPGRSDDKADVALLMGSVNTSTGSQQISSLRRARP
ncbi:MAG: DUF2846 domain-containing protein [Myxococcota bacterium]|nr:DUF2846 domain-containing protein [Myxococcota bacterium]